MNRVRRHGQGAEAAEEDDGIKGSEIIWPEKASNEMESAGRAICGMYM